MIGQTMGAMNITLVLTFFCLLVAVAGSDRSQPCAPRSAMVLGEADTDTDPQWYSINFCTGRDQNSGPNDFCVVDEFADLPEIFVHLGEEYYSPGLHVKSAKSCKMEKACKLDTNDNSVTGEPVCYPGLEWNRSSCRCEPIKPKAKPCTGKATKIWPHHEGHAQQQIPLNLFIFALVGELLFVVSVSFCIVSRTCRRRSSELSRQLSQQMADTRREVSRQLSFPGGGVSRQHSERLMDDPEPDDYDFGRFTAR